jgi:hypothetical protein
MRHARLARGGQADADAQPERRGQASAHQAAPQPFAAAGQADLHRPDRPAKLARHFLAGVSFEVTEHERRAVRLAQAAELLVEHAAEVVRRLDDAGGRGDFGGRLVLVRPSPARRAPDLSGGAEGDAVEPASARGPVPDRAGLAEQDEEGRLKGVLDVVRVAQGVPADAEDHRPVPVDQGREGGFRGLAASCEEAVEQLSVGEAGDDSEVEESMDLFQDVPASAGQHGSSPSGTVLAWSGLDTPAPALASCTRPGVALL